MTSSGSEYKESPSPSPESASPVLSPLKRRRSSSAGSLPPRKRAAPYNDAYRLLYNEFVQTITRTTDFDGPWRDSQLGASLWLASEKEAFFRALERLGKDDLPGITAAVRTKNALEIRQFLLLLQDAAFDRAGKRDVSLEAVPAAAEISVVCERQLDAAGQTLAIMQERFEATLEQNRYNQHWLINATLADEIELATKGLRASAPVESGDDGELLDALSSSPLLQEIPEAKLLNPKAFLDLSRNVFMNPSPDTSYPWPHWQELVSELASEPCMYRTAFRDLHTLTLSITKRILQTVLIQATSRIRSQGWRTTKGVKPFVRSSDVYTALDLLGMKKSKVPYWRDVPRRCRLRVTEGRYRKLRVYRWDEVERKLDSVSDNHFASLDSGTDTEGFISDGERKAFKFRAARSGTPLPPPRRSTSEDSNHTAENVDSMDDPEDDAPEEESGSDTDPYVGDVEELSEGLASEEEESFYDSTDAEEEGLEAFDQATSRKEERKLWSILGNAPEDVLTGPSEGEPRKTPRRRMKDKGDDWRTWTQYHPEWEEHRTTVPAIDFIKNRRSASPPVMWDPATDYETDFANDTGRSSGDEDRSNKPQPMELPLRDPRSYAALRGREPSSERDIDSDLAENDADVPAQSIENTIDSMEWQ